jgi:hypothetical protein
MHGWKLKATELPFMLNANTPGDAALFDCHQLSFPLLAAIRSGAKMASRRRKTIFNPILV